MGEKTFLGVKNFQEIILENIPDLVFVKDEKFRIVQANPAFINVYPQHLHDKIIGYTTIEGYDEKEAEEFLAMDKKALEEGFSQIEETIHFPDGETRTLMTKKVRFENEQKEKFILGVSRDITDMKRIQQKLIEAEKELLRSNQDLDDFAYIASHDLKEPLRGIYNYAKILREEYQESLDEDAQHKVNRMIYLSERMEKLINDLLYYARLGHNKKSYQSTDLNEVIEDIRHMLSDQKNVNIAIQGTLPTIICNRTRIIDLYLNLITNAIKYNKSNEKEVEIGFKEGNIRGDVKELVFFVKDNGIGIDKRFHDDIFKIFKRLHKRDAYGGGTGAGLTFVKKIVDRHGGEIWLDSELGKGTTFYFTLKG